MSNELSKDVKHQIFNIVRESVLAGYEIGCGNQDLVGNNMHIYPVNKAKEIFSLLEKEPVRSPDARETINAEMLELLNRCLSYFYDQPLELESYEQESFLAQDIKDLISRAGEMVK